MSITTDAAVVISSGQMSRIRGQESNDILVTRYEEGEMAIFQEDMSQDNTIVLSPAEAEALFLVLDTMLHPDQE